MLRFQSAGGANFSAGIADLFVVRTAGNVVGDIELGSVEYAARYLGARLIVVMGHTRCGAVEAAIQGGFDGYTGKVVHEVSSCIYDEQDMTAAENLNIKNMAKRVMDIPFIREAEGAGRLMVVEAKYDLASGFVEFFT